jgi:hypothetical protein
MFSILLNRDKWPWIMTTGFCFIMGLGNFESIARKPGGFGEQIAIAGRTSW